jgi:hypothetical protein
VKVDILERQGFGHGIFEADMVKLNHGQSVSCF